MSLKNVAVEGMTLTYKVSADGDATAVSALGPENENVKIDGKKVYSDGLSIALSNVSCTSIQLVSGEGSGSFVSSSSYVSADGKQVLLEGDTASVTVTGVNSSSGSPMTVLVTVTITSAGQTAAKAE